jgi:polysaccharide deacetylase family protein (PEP-CTERM system associated)
MPESLAFGPPVISIDVEDWRQSTWDRNLSISPRAVENTDRMLELLGRAGVSATMFVLGKLAEAFPDVVKRIHAAGHEVACHGHGHVEVFKQSREEFASDVRRAKQTLEDITGEPVRGYRAPDFSILDGTLWALDVLAELGFDYDSSIFPIRHSRYGIATWPREPARVKLSSGRAIVELPIATLELFGRRVPVGGGGYHRLLPGAVARSAAARVMRETVFVYYCHPYEVDPRELWETDLPIPLRVRLHQGLGRGRFQRRLERFLQRFGGRTMWTAASGAVLPEIAAEGLSEKPTSARYQHD